MRGIRAADAAVAMRAVQSKKLNGSVPRLRRTMRTQRRRGPDPVNCCMRRGTHRNHRDVAPPLPELRSDFSRGQDEVGLCQTLQLEAAMHWNHARSAAAEDAWCRAAEYARRAYDRRQLTEILGWLASAALWGPTPAPEGIQRCVNYLAEIGDHPRGQVARKPVPSQRQEPETCLWS